MTLLDATFESETDCGDTILSYDEYACNMEHRLNTENQESESFLVSK
jgi:hypothetical protein